MTEYVTREEYQALRGTLEGVRDAVQAFAAENRSPSKALLIGQGGRSVTAEQVDVAAKLSPSYRAPGR